MRRKITKQKLYERVVLDTYRYSNLDAITTERTAIESAGYDLFNMTFDELRMARAILGLELPVPDKQPFDKLGFKYFAQVTGFVLNQGDDELIYMYFSVLDGYPELIDFSDKTQSRFMYDVFLDQIPKNTYVCRRLGPYLFRHAENCDWYPRFLSIAYGLGMFNNDVSLDEILEMKKKHPLEGNVT